MQPINQQNRPLQQGPHISEFSIQRPTHRKLDSPNDLPKKRNLTLVFPLIIIPPYR
jgi:hypothetical protein